ncbi:chitin-binding protein [Pseudomonas sp. SDI]|uniref:lytic polysaccharide monooxygenase auxiliary activity family 9 protein n=1 Tax=Pseudomonas sp. SDI TaxID=2170734 RepID=UPI000DE66BFA|nr:lytic polysaccharide monooxygenase auxiliary activity family 9 protein [Pseudomonas sp. SDI]PWB35165.1 chitin-binding protein [Pseudomonas sp. SDI]
MKRFKLAAACFFAVYGVMVVAAAEEPRHGSTEFPMSRQLICKAQGGYEENADGSKIPNAACKAAFLYGDLQPWERARMFNDWAAYSQNLEGGKPEAKVPDGQLCSAGVPGFRGINEPSAAWTATTVPVTGGDNATLKFKASQAHEPSSWKVYVSKNSYDSATQLLTRSDLQELQVTSVELVMDGQVVDGKAALPRGPGQYTLVVKVPGEALSGKKAVLYVEWHRDEHPNETFFACSDVMFSDK